MRRLIFGIACLAVTSTAACGSDGDTNSNQQDLVTEQYTIQPGEEKYICYTFRSPADRKVGITDVVSESGLGVHHIVMFQTAPEEDDGSWECPQLVRTNWQPIWAGGTGNPSLHVPDGAAFQILPNTQYLVQLHLQNVSDQPIVDTSKISLTYAPPEELESLQGAGIYALGSFDISIPNESVDHTLTVDCVADRDLNVFAAFPHMHKLGRRIEFQTGPTADSMNMAYDLDPWPFDDQPMDVVDWKISTGDHMRSVCHWDNNTGKEVTFGESSDDEMCFFVMFYYPFDALAGCIEGQQ